MGEEGKLELSANDSEQVRCILLKLIPGVEVWAFGSRTKGTARQYSDLDLAVITRQPLPITTMAALREAFDESDLTIKVDIVDWASTKEPFRRIIEENKVVVQRGSCPEGRDGKTIDEGTKVT